MKLKFLEYDCGFTKKRDLTTFLNKRFSAGYWF